jgi:hypothetical protein
MTRDLNTFQKITEKLEERKPVEKPEPHKVIGS